MRTASLLPLLAALASCTFAPPSIACGSPAAPPCRALADIEIVDRNTGERLPILWHDGQRWIAGTPGHRYAVTLRNRTAGRVMTVLSVDGVNAISGATADWKQGGYVLLPGQSYDVLGWRKSLDDVADFVFTSVPDSYAARTGRPDNVGVIGVAVFSEKPAPPPVGLARRAQPAAPSVGAPATDAATSGAAGAAPAPLPELSEQAQSFKAAPANRMLERQQLGTGHGQIETSVVQDTDFEPAQAEPEQLVTIRYDRRERLVALGILPSPEPTPRAFPAAASQGFAADPPRLGLPVR